MGAPFGGQNDPSFFVSPPKKIDGDPGRSAGPKPKPRRIRRRRQEQTPGVQQRQDRERSPSPWTCPGGLGLRELYRPLLDPQGDVHGRDLAVVQIWTHVTRGAMKGVVAGLSISIVDQPGVEKGLEAPVDSHRRRRRGSQEEVDGFTTRALGPGSELWPPCRW